MVKVERLVIPDLKPLPEVKEESRVLNDMKQEAQETAVGYGAGLGASVVHHGLTGEAFKAARFIPQAKLGLLGYDAYNGYNNAEALYTNPELKQKLASSAGEVVNGLTFGFIPAKDVSYGLVPPLGAHSVVHEPVKK